MADFSKDKLISSLLQPNSGGSKTGRPIIEEIGTEGGTAGRSEKEEEIIELNDAGEFEVSSPKKQNASQESANAPAPTPAAVPEPEGPSLFDEMMAAQAAAKKEKEKVNAKAKTSHLALGSRRVSWAAVVGQRRRRPRLLRLQTTKGPMSSMLRLRLEDQKSLCHNH